MGRFLVLFLVLGFLSILPQGKVFATSVEVGDISNEKSGVIAFEGIYSRTFERDLKANDGENDKIGSMDQVHLKISYIKFKEAQPYFKIGTAQFKDEMDNVSIAGLGNRDLDFKYDPVLSLGGGLSGLFNPNENNYLIGYDLQYLRSKNDLGEVTHNGEKASGVKGNAVLQEWHTALWLGKEFDVSQMLGGAAKLTPYIGGRFSNLELEIKKDVEYTVSEGTIGVTGNNKAENKAGIFVGGILNIGDNWKVRLEGRFIDETALTVSTGYRF